jgi:hypothetical protein
MKLVLAFFILLLIIVQSCFGQQPSDKKYPLTKEDFLKRSHEQKTGGLILLGVGAGSIALVSGGNQSFETTGTVAVLGGIAVLASVPLFIASGRNRRKARAAERASRVMAIGEEYINYRFNQAICREELLSGIQVLQQQPSD